MKGSTAMNIVGAITAFGLMSIIGITVYFSAFPNIELERIVVISAVTIMIILAIIVCVLLNKNSSQAHDKVSRY